jgi:hypothetical protein
MSARKRAPTPANSEASRLAIVVPSSTVVRTLFPASGLRHGARVTRTRPGFDAVECARPLTRLTWLNALRMCEHVVRVEGGLDLFEPVEIRSPVRVLPAGQDLIGAYWPPS